jgi:glutamine amidotransferase
MGWAQVGDDDYYYFAHSYAAETPAATAWSEGIVAEARAGSFVGCQFHPEKSQRLGLALIANFLKWKP